MPELVDMFTGPFGGALAIAFMAGAGSAWRFSMGLHLRREKDLKAQVENLIKYAYKIEARLEQVEDHRVRLIDRIARLDERRID